MSRIHSTSERKNPPDFRREGAKCEIRSVIYTTNAIERTIKEIRKRLKPMNSLSSLEAAEKIVYLTIQDFNEKWAERKLRGFAEAQEALQRMFEERYN
ncbi:Transposase of IS654-like element [Geobacillus thermoleovorans CCB_US3_UF5]|uniref:Transposase of IS654-like element n=1 Tax=Geobacillus thermoleovorans CCB_US3_UF5 TaxID=1111068 RepID=A0ABM5ME54_GEOTH|nr:Transposase of IS654-like element [Geobacillus thermoleovorans CCB_US3_UF5]QDY72287.1 transposase [Geobacillus thermoleovorans]